MRRERVNSRSGRFGRISQSRENGAMTMLGNIAEQTGPGFPQMAVAGIERVTAQGTRREAFLVRDPDQSVTAYQLGEG